ncbi:unnamed protein product [Microthlaspi erraticum]|uniref:Uncharacterized protein n=1 Tax=Microthlaspi erraticum TaxID=1685480 RepID=A0A6D2JT17_9BRAS|nr:unnamed protein product [Microthlaspi erraticum]CAA7051464.1 unnamed protein product [Microthlaspi erraticum]
MSLSWRPEAWLNPCRSRRAKQDEEDKEEEEEEEEEEERTDHLEREKEEVLLLKGLVEHGAKNPDFDWDKFLSYAQGSGKEKLTEDEMRSKIGELQRKYLCQRKCLEQGQEHLFVFTRTMILKLLGMQTSSGAILMNRRTRKEETMSALNENGAEQTEEGRTVGEESREDDGDDEKAVTGEVGKKRVDAVMIDKTPLVIITPQVTPIARGSVSPVTKGNKSSENGLGNDSTPPKLPEVENSQDESRKRKRGEKLNETALPFEKNKSPYWKTLGSRKSIPHFRPLLEAREDIREWAAVGMMVSYYGLLEQVRDLKPNDSTSTFDRLCVSFAELGKHGFDIAEPQSRIVKVLSLKDGLAKKAEERNKLEEAAREKRKAEEEMAELQREILELQRRGAIAQEEKKAAEKMMLEMKSNAETIEREIEEMEETLNADEQAVNASLSENQKKIHLEKMMKNIGDVQRRELSDEWKVLCSEEARLMSRSLSLRLSLQRLQTMDENKKAIASILVM